MSKNKRQRGRDIGREKGREERRKEREKRILSLLRMLNRGCWVGKRTRIVVRKKYDIYKKLSPNKLSY